MVDKDKICFIICPLGEDNSEIRNWSDLVFDFIISPVVTEFGYEPKRPHEIQKSGWITNQIINYIIEADLVIADLTNYNPNVFYELAIRHITQKPCIEMIKVGSKIPFDINGMRTVYTELDLRSAEAAKKKLREHINSIIADGFKADNPISQARRLNYIQQLIDKGISTTEQPEIKNILEILKSLQIQIGNLNSEETIQTPMPNTVVPEQIGINPKVGTVYGRATSTGKYMGNDVGLANAKVTLVDASNPQREFIRVFSDAHGDYVFNNVFPKLNQLYRVSINHTLFGFGLSEPFPVRENETVNMNVEITPIPAHIKAHSEFTELNASGKSVFNVWAYVRNALLNPVQDGERIRFEIVGSQNGSVSLYEMGSSEPKGKMIVVVTKDGFAKAKLEINRKEGEYSLKTLVLNDPSIQDSININIVSKK